MEKPKGTFWLNNTYISISILWARADMNAPFYNFQVSGIYVRFQILSIYKN